MKKPTKEQFRAALKQREVHREKHKVDKKFTDMATCAFGECKLAIHTLLWRTQNGQATGFEEVEG
jgi:hypothetical protein